MQIVIDIPEKSFNAIKNGCFAFDDDINDLFSWIADGIPFPKHDSLIDVDYANGKVKKLCEKWGWAYGGEDVGTMGYDMAHLFDKAESEVEE